MGLWIMERRFQTVKEQTLPVYSFLLDLFFPPRCVYCKKIGKRICDPCAAGITWIDSRHCRWCGLPQKSRRPHACIHPSRLQFIRSAAEFSGPLRKALHAFKYDSDRSLAAQLVQLAYPHWSLPTWEFDLLIPVPLGRIRERMRGYNQSLLLANALSQKVNIPVDAGCLARVRETQTQVGLSYGARKQNMANAFHASSVKGKRVLLVDDVCTTGATLLSCAEALAQAGAERIGALTLARAILPAVRPES
jgi:ComF family protein